VHLFIVGESPHDSWIHNAVEQHGEWVHRKGPVPRMLLHTVANPLIGQFHGFYGILQRADFLLRDGAKGEEHFVRPTAKTEVQLTLPLKKY
jgi:hypothetical protein